ncbi:MAG TPA: hypothetical protein VMK65_13275 [Longimicrobiales bacterium]|nr:hypothetical protein [Longimicrobiales bacterium]
MRSGRILIVAVALATGVAAGFVAVADPVAVVVKLDGALQVQRAGGGDPVTGEVGMALSAGDRLLPAAGARVVLLHSTGRTEVAAEPLTLAAPEQGQRAGVFTRAVRTIESVAATSAKADPNRQGMIRPVPGTPVPVAPRNGIALLDTRPTFTWHSVPGASAYMVQLRAAGERPVRFDVGPDTVWTYPDSATALRHGAIYQWTVGAVGASARVAESVGFRVLDSAAAGEITSALAGLKAQGLEPEGDAPFLAAVLYHDAGLAYEADRLLARLQATGAGEGRTFHLLRAEVYDALGKLDAAAREFALADAAARE